MASDAAAHLAKPFSPRQLGELAYRLSPAEPAKSAKTEPRAFDRGRLPGVMSVPCVCGFFPRTLLSRTLLRW